MSSYAIKPEMKVVGQTEAKCLPPCAIEQKYDGMLTYYMAGTLMSDRMINNTNKYKHIAQELKMLGVPDSCILVGEIYVPGGNVFTVNTIVNYGKAHFCVFDIIQADGADIKGETFIRRQEILDKILKPSEVVHFPKDFENFETAWKFVEDTNAEGVVMKELNKPYGVGWYKCKKLLEFKLKILAFDNPENKKGAFVLEGGSRCDALSSSFVQQYEGIKAMGGVPMAELESPFLTSEGKLFQPRLRRIFNEVTG
jgi:ATP-dependent DNA ligase